MPPARLPGAASMGEVHLTVRDLDESLAFYVGELGMRALVADGDEAVLGSDQPLLRLTEAADARPRPPGTSGLYHVAYLLPTRPDLARFVARLVERRTPVQGASDHDVSEAIYLADPDGHGIEVYADRPRTSWRFRGRELEIGTRPLDVESLLEDTEGRSWRGLPEGSTVGHVHLHVGDVVAADTFYRDVVGFERMMGMPSASFLAAGGYHHHLAVNVWQGLGAPPPPPGTLGLVSYTLRVPDADAREALRERLGLRDEDALARDPSGNAFQARA